jgi:hypothetical protein
MFSGTSTEGFIQDQLHDPTSFFTASYILLVASFIFCAAQLYRVAIAISSEDQRDPFLATAITLMYFAIHPLSISTLTLWSHTSFNFPFGTLYLIALLRLAQKNEDIPFSTIVILGLGAGFLTATMVYFASWVISSIIFITVLYWIKKNRRTQIIKTALTLAGFSLLGFILALLPAIKRMPYFANWILGLILHQGTYGEGAIGITTLPILWNSFLNILRTLPAFSIYIFSILILFVYITINAKGKVSGISETWSLAFALIIQVIILLMFDLKHPGGNTLVTNRYLLPIAATMPVLTLLVLQLIKISPRLYSFARYAIILFVFVNYLYLLSASLINHKIKSEALSKVSNESSKVIKKYAQETGQSIDQLHILWTYGTFSPCYSLSFGNQSAGLIFSTEIVNICRQQNTLNIWNHEVIIGNNVMDIENTEWDLIFTRGYILDGYPFLKQLGKIDEFLPSLPPSIDSYGSFIVIYK